MELIFFWQIYQGRCRNAKEVRNAECRHVPSEVRDMLILSRVGHQDEGLHWLPVPGFCMCLNTIFAPGTVLCFLYMEREKYQLYKVIVSCCISQALHTPQTAGMSLDRNTCISENIQLLKPKISVGMHTLSTTFQVMQWKRVGSCEDVPGWLFTQGQHLPPTSGGHTCDGYEWLGLSLHHFQQLLGLSYQGNGNKCKFLFWGNPILLLLWNISAILRNSLFQTLLFIFYLVKIIEFLSVQFSLFSIT